LPIADFKLLNSSTGWASTGKRLLWTTDGGAHWKDISPPNPYDDSYADVFFLDEVTGWVLFSHLAEDVDDPLPGNPKSDWTFYLAATQNGGKTWTTIRIPALLEEEGDDLGGGGQIAFGDRLNGWIEVGYRNGGSLLHTSDGGLHWDWVKNGPGLSASLRAVSGQRLFVAGDDIQGNYLYATWDAGQTFHRISLPRPPVIAADATSSHALPDFVDSQTGYEAVTYSPASGTNSAVLYITRDGGHTWAAGRILTGIDSDSGTPSTVVDSTWVIPLKPEGKGLSWLKLPVAGGMIAAPPNQSQDIGCCSPSFWGSSAGWAGSGSGLSSTDDGGATWTIINPRYVVGTGALTTAPVTPPPPPPPPGHPFTSPHFGAVPRPQPPSASIAAPALTTSLLPGGLSQQLGFDTNKVPSVSNMATWWADSPYYDIAIYLLGSPNKGRNRRLTPGWVTKVHNQGWGIIPIWFGLQDPCLVHTKGVTSYFSSTPAIAYSDGINQAALAYASADVLGLGDSVIYLDIEHYTYAANSTCSLAAQAYVSGFVSAIHGAVGAVGVYGSIEDTPDIYQACDQTDRCSPPDYFWLGRADNRATVWNLGHGEYTSDVSDYQWPVNERAHQYSNTHEETWGGIPLSIDNDIVDSRIVTGNPSLKPLNVNTIPTPVTYPSAFATVVTAIANGTNNGTFTDGTVVGYANGSIPFKQEANGTPQDLPVPSSPPSCGLQYWVFPTGINHEGTVVGYSTLPSDGPIQAGMSATGIPESIGASTVCYGAEGIIWRKSGGYTIYNDPDSYKTELLSINDAGWITGSMLDNSGNYHCILLKPENGHYKGVTPTEFDEGGGSCEAAVINGIGIIAGNYFDSSGYEYAFYDDVEDGIPGDYGVSLGSSGDIYGVNNNGFVVDPGAIWSLFTPAGYSFPSSTTVYGLNDDPEIVGFDFSGDTQEGVIYDTVH
jgi:photosystem II stability/assembly factor-like uncharacterized protein